MLGSSWNGFGVAGDTASGVVVAIASNIEFDQPDELMASVIEIVRPAGTNASAPGRPGLGEK